MTERNIFFRNTLPAPDLELAIQETIAAGCTFARSGRRWTMKALAAMAGGLVVLVAVAPGAVHARDREGPPARAGERVHGRARGFPNTPQMAVVCTGWHALCTASPDCRMNGDEADCDCARVDEAHIVVTSEIQDAGVKRRTESRCTDAHPCEVDEAPVCEAIRSGHYAVDRVEYEWVSTYSYRGWCSILDPKPRACDTGAIGYAGDRYWALCDAAPCTENASPSDPERPLTCQCRVASEPFVGMRGTCTGRNGGIMSSMPVWAWDFDRDTYPFPMPGYEYVRGACAPFGSEPAPGPLPKG